VQTYWLSGGSHCWRTATEAPRRRWASGRRASPCHLTAAAMESCFRYIMLQQATQQIRAALRYFSYVWKNEVRLFRWFEVKMSRVISANILQKVATLLLFFDIRKEMQLNTCELRYRTYEEVCVRRHTKACCILQISQTVTLFNSMWSLFYCYFAPLFKCYRKLNVE